MGLVATLKHAQSGNGLSGYSQAQKAAFLFLGLAFAGTGRYSLD